MRITHLARKLERSFRAGKSVCILAARRRDHREGREKVRVLIRPAETVALREKCMRFRYEGVPVAARVIVPDENRPGETG